MDWVMTAIWMWIWLLLAASAMAQTAAPPAAKGDPQNPRPGPDSAQPVPPPVAHPPPGNPPGAAAARRDALAKQKAAMEAQRQAVRLQAETAGAWMLPLAGLHYVETPCEPIADAVVAPLIEGASKSQKVEPKLLRAVIDQESGFHPCAISSTGAKGLMQLMPETADQYSLRDPFDPRQNIEAGASYLKQLLDRYNGDLSQALAAYNAGPRRVDESGGIPDIPETRNYVDSILEKLKAKDPDPPPDPKPKPPAK